jgi:hypothetical protein
MPRYAPNKMPAAVKRRYFELIRTGLSGSAVAPRSGGVVELRVMWFIDAGRVSFIETVISTRYLSQDDRIEIADGLARVSRSSRLRPGSGRPIKASTERSPATASQMAATSAGMRTTGPTSGADDPSRAGSASMPSWLRPWPVSSQSAGHRPRSAAGCGAASKEQFLATSPPAAPATAQRSDQRHHLTPPQDRLRLPQRNYRLRMILEARRVSHPNLR